MVCHLPDNPLHRHGQHVLARATGSSKSWFNQVRDLCSLYGLPDPQDLLNNPPKKSIFKELVKANVAKYWHEIFINEISGLKSLKYFKPELYSLTKPHYMWSLAASRPYETAKSTVLATMASGRYRTDMLTRYWGKNRNGYCRAPCCSTTPGTLEHLLVVCPALSTTRDRLYQMWLERTVMFPTLHATVRAVLESPDHTIVQFVLEPLAFPDILTDFVSYGVHFAHLLAYLTRTFAFCMHRDYQRLIKQLDDPTHHQVMTMYPTNVSSFAVPMCELTRHQLALHTTGHQDSPAEPGQRCVVERNTNTVQLYSQPVRQSCSNVTNDKPCLGCPDCVACLVPSSVLPVVTTAVSAQVTSIGDTNTAVTCVTRSFCSNTDTNLPSASRLSSDYDYQYQYQDYQGGFCGEWGSYDHLVQVSP